MEKRRCFTQFKLSQLLQLRQSSFDSAQTKSSCSDLDSKHARRREKSRAFEILRVMCYKYRRDHIISEAKNTCKLHSLSFWWTWKEKIPVKASLELQIKIVIHKGGRNVFCHNHHFDNRYHLYDMDHLFNPGFIVMLCDTDIKSWIFRLNESFMDFLFFSMISSFSIPYVYIKSTVTSVSFKQFLAVNVRLVISLL